MFGLSGPHSGTRLMLFGRPWPRRDLGVIIDLKCHWSVWVNSPRALAYYTMRSVWGWCPVEASEIPDHAYVFSKKKENSKNYANCLCFIYIFNKKAVSVDKLNLLGCILAAIAFTPSAGSLRLWFISQSHNVKLFVRIKSSGEQYGLFSISATNRYNLTLLCQRLSKSSHWVALPASWVKN